MTVEWWLRELRSQLRDDLPKFADEPIEFRQGYAGGAFRSLDLIEGVLLEHADRALELLDAAAEIRDLRAQLAQFVDGVAVHETRLSRAVAAVRRWLHR